MPFGWKTQTIERRRKKNESDDTKEGEKEVIPYDYSEWEENDDDEHTDVLMRTPLLNLVKGPTVQEFFKEAFRIEEPVHIVGCVITGQTK